MAARRIILYVLYVLVLVGLVAAIVVAFHSNDNNKNETKKQTTAKQQSEQQKKQAAEKKAADQKAAEQKKQQSGQVATNTPGAATQQAKPAYTAPSTQTAPGTAAGGKGGQDLTNTGPGEVAALFGAVVVSGTLYYSHRQRKQLV
jgi:peptidoglycan hydrolase CwlO-like protein